MFLSKHRNLYRITQKLILRMTTTAPEKSVREGSVEIYVASDKVFYNPVQEFNRDLSIAVLNVFTSEYKAEKQQKYEEKKRRNNPRDNIDMDNEFEVDVVLLEALSATGLRSIRYAKEVENLTKVVANDMCEAAVTTIKDNVVHNEVEDKIEVSLADATILMYKHREPKLRFAAVDLDPYGCPTMFLDAAVQCVQDGGLLLVTATDMAVLAGNSPETSYSKYGAISLKTKSCHEMALRILLQSIERHAIQYGRYIVPLLSVSVDFYIRVFVKVYTGAKQCKKSCSKMSMVYLCTGCDNVVLQPLIKIKSAPTEKNPNLEKAYLPTLTPVGEFCDNCKQRYHLGGPIWSGALHDEAFVSRVLMWVQAQAQAWSALATTKRLCGVLAVVREELHDAPLYHCMTKLFGSAHLETMPIMLMRSAILNAGYRVSYSHASKTSIKTNAPQDFVWDIVRTWAKTHPAKPAKLESDARARNILSHEIRHAVDLTLRDDANPDSRRRSALRFQHNPAPHWGPGTRAELKVCEQPTKAQRNQNKSRGQNDQKRGHSPASEDEARKKTDTDMETSET